MATDPVNASDPTRSPVPDEVSNDPHAVPVPRLGTPARESAEESVSGQRDAVGDGPDVGGLTPTDDAQ